MGTFYRQEYVSILFEPILSILEANPQGISEYYLMKELSKSHFPFLREDKESEDLQLFRSHFFLFHVLYRLRDTLLEEKRYILSIFCLEIKLTPYSESDVHDYIPVESDKVRKYYLDLEQMWEVDEEEVKQMLDSFFVKLEAYYRADNDLAVLGLPPDSGMEAIRKRYRSLAFTHHPDRGGDADEFRRIDEAMRRLENIYGK